MRKYWYYTFETGKETGYGISCTENGEFDITKIILAFDNNKKDNSIMVITGWHEISSSQYESLDKYFESLKK